jgi:phenylacetaldehyde dehydrogenase
MVERDPASLSWPGLSLRVRCDRIAHLGTIIAKRQKEIVQIVAQETGKPVTEVINQEVTAALEMLRYCAKMAPRWLQQEKFRYWRPGFWTKSNTIYFEPLGTILIIGPSNFPFSLPLMQACAALVCGNRVILKPSEHCPRTAFLVGELFAEASFPPGAIEVVPGGPEVAEQLIMRDDVRKVVFTGSCETGHKVAAACGRAFTPSILELGGGSTAIICEDADLALAARGIAWSAFYANGRSCVGTKRVFVHAGIGRKFVELLSAEMAAIRAGDPTDPATDLGDLSGPGAAGRATLLLRDAEDKGAEIWSARGPIKDAESASTCAPLLILKSSPGMRLMQEESSWPMLAVREVSSDEQALHEANQPGFGLGASLWSRNLTHARAMAQKIHAGMVWINDSSVGLPQFPWGGEKQSGWGRMFSQHGLRELTNIKVVSCERQRLSKSKLWWFPYSARKHDIFAAVNDWFARSGRIRTLIRILAAFFRAKD